MFCFLRILFSLFFVFYTPFLFSQETALPPEKSVPLRKENKTPPSGAKAGAGASAGATSASSPSLSPSPSPAPSFPDARKTKEANLEQTPKSSQKKTSGQSFSLKNSASLSQINFTSQTQVILGDGRSVQGKLRIKVPPQLRIHHLKDGIRYSKEISMEDIGSIEFKTWKGKFLKRKPQGEIYSFKVIRYVIHLKSGQSLMYIGSLLPFLSEFTLSNSNGYVRLYSYWLDLYKEKGGWHTGLKGSSGTERVLCHPDVIKKILFLAK